MLKLQKAFRTNINTVKVLYLHTQLRHEFLVEWCNINPATGAVTNYDLNGGVLANSQEFLERIENAIREGESDDNPDCDLYLAIRDTFDSLDCENLDTLEENVEITSISVYETDNGFKIKAVVYGEEYSVYAQLPDCPDSQHSFLSGSENKEILGAIINEAKKKFGEMDYAVFCKLGSVTDYSYETYNNDYYYVVIDNSDSNNYFYAKKSRYSDYYNIFAFENLDEHDCQDDDLMSKLYNLLRELRD